MKTTIISSRSKGICYIILSAFCFACMNVFVRISGELPSIQKSFFRNLVAFVFAWVILLKNKEEYKIPKGNLKFLLLRALFGTLGILCNFYAVDHLLLADASILNKLSPFFGILFSYFILKEKASPLQLTAVVAAFLGSLLIIKPGFRGTDVIPATIGLIGGMSAGMAYTMVRLLGKRGQKAAFVVFFFSGFSCLVTLPYLIFSYHPMQPWQVFSLLAAGLAAAGGQFSITAAYFHAPAKEISIYDYSQIVFSAVLGYFLFAQVPDNLSILGYGIIFVMALVNFRITGRTQADSDSKP